MKWVLVSALSLIFPIYASSNLKSKPEKEQIPDLFKENAQVYSGHAEFLYWDVMAGDLDYALKMRHSAWGPTDSYAQGRFETATYGMDPGFRAALSYFRAPHYWEIKWQYTRLTSRGKNSVNKPNEGEKFLTGTWPQVTELPLTGATSHIHLNYNVLEWLADRVFFPNPHLRLRVIGGALSAWMNQDWKVRYFDATGNSTTIRNKWDFFGGGLKTGTVVDWYWTGELYLTAGASFGVLVGTYSNKAKQTTTIQPTDADNPNVPIRDASYHDVRPTMTAQLLIGPSWQRNYPNNRIEVFAGFEMNTWFNLQEIYRSTSGSPSEAKQTWINSSMLGLYGLTTRLTVDF